MLAIGILFTLLVSLNLAVFWLWIVRRIDKRGYGSASRKARMAQMMPLVDQDAAGSTLVIERNDHGRDQVRTVTAEPGASAGGVA